MVEAAPAPPSPRPLDGLRVVAIEQLQAMPYATQLFAWMGAEVIKVESLKGEAGRTASPALRDVDGELVGATYLRNNLSKRSVCIDINTDDGAGLVHRLLQHCDVLAENFRPGVLDRAGLGYDEVHARAPHVVYASVSGFGHDRSSPYFDWPAYAPVAETMAGFYELRRNGDQFPPIGLGSAFGDMCAAVFAAVGILSALRHRDRTGQGQHVDIAMFDAMVAFGDMICFMPSMGVPHPVQRARGINAGFRASDGFFVMTVLREHQFARLCRLINCEEWLSDPRLADRDGWVDQLDALIRPAVERWAAGLTKEAAARELANAGIPAAPSLRHDELARDPHVRAHQMLIDVPRPDAESPLVVSGQPMRFSGTPCPAVGRWPTLGADTDAVLGELLGLGQTEIDALRSRGVVR